MPSSRTSSPASLTSKEVEVPGGEQTSQSPRLHDEERALPDASIKETVRQDQDGERFLVSWDPDESANPRNWSKTYRWWITLQLGLLAFAASLASSIISPAEPAIAEYVGVSIEVTVLSISLYVLGFAFGPLLWAPLSEISGRRVSMLPALIGLGLFSIGTATSKTAASVFITRFFGGIFGSAPVSNVSAALGDIWSPKERGVAVTFYAVAVVGGPTLGPVIGSALTANTHLGWRWTEYMVAIITFAVVILAYFCFPEVYEPYLLKKKAHRLRKETGDSRYYHPHENVKVDVRSMITKHFSRPIVMLTTEPMVTVMALYASFVFALLYMTLEVFPIVFEQNRHWPLVSSTLPFCALFVGVLCAVLINLANQPRYARIVEKANGKPVPEARLPPMAVGAFLYAIGLFWFGWTADPSIPWPSCVVAIAFIGAGFNIIFQQAINFLVDTYRLYAASAVSANTFLRSLMAAGLPLAARPMFENLGVGPAMSILGGVATLALPIPFLFMKFGLKLRRMSKFAPVED